MKQEGDFQEEIKESLDDIRRAVLALSGRIENQEARIARMEKANFSRMESSQSQKSFSSKSDFLPPPPPPLPSQKEALAFSNSKPDGQIIPQEKIGLEENIGVKWFGRIGMTALVLGISFFLKYAFDNNWIGETGRVIIGIFAGLALLGLGERYIRKYQMYGQLMSGGGIAVLYLSIFAAFNFYHLIGQFPAFIAMIMVTAIGVILSIRYDAISLIVVSILGGFATPFLISNGQNNQWGLFSYVLLLDAAILAVSIFKKWRELNIIGLTGTVITVSAWSSQYYRHEDLFFMFFFLTLFFMVYSVSALIYNLVKKEKSSGVEQFMLLISGSIYFSSSYALLNPDYHALMGFFTLLTGIYYFLWAYLIRMFTPEDENLYNFSAFFTFAFITLAIPIQFEQKIITLGWAIEAALLLIIGIKVKRESLKAFGIVVFGLAILRLFAIDSSYANEDSVIFNKTFAIFLFIIILSYVLSAIIKFLGKVEAEKNGKDGFLSIAQLVATFVIMANFLTVFIGSREIGQYYDQEIEKIVAEDSRVYQESLKYNSSSDKSNYGEMYEDESYWQSEGKLQKLQNKSSVSLSIFWLIYGIILMTIGIVGKQKELRIGGIVLLLLAIFKLFFYDLWSLGTLYRIISSISLGVVLLGISFSYQKYKDKIRELI